MFIMYVCLHVCDLCASPCLTGSVYYWMSHGSASIGFALVNQMTPGTTSPSWPEIG